MNDMVDGRLEAVMLLVAVSSRITHIGDRGSRAVMSEKGSNI